MRALASCRAQRCEDGLDGRARQLTGRRTGRLNGTNRELQIEA
jgi:hypothetical protein